ncbi:MAG TPA: 50S ribosomal protein L21 [Phycisphaerae bacterium]
MYAIIEDGSHQYKVAEGDTIEVQLHDVPEGTQTLEFDHVLLVGDGAAVTVGRPYVPGARVTASAGGVVKGDKIRIIKFRRRKGYKRRAGHRQQYLRLTVDKITA